jgi:hypothetical protein
MSFAPNTCQVKIKMRAMASYSKIPGFPKLSGYKFMNMNRTNVIINEKQMLAVIDRLTKNEYWQANFNSVVKD